MVKKKRNPSRGKKYFLIASALVFILLVLPFTFSLSQKSQDDQQVAATTAASVSIVDFAFQPATITVAAGTTVTWTNMSASGAMHTTSSDAQGTANSWDSGLTQKGTTYSHTFNTPGTFSYHCNVHTFMRGTITVTAAGAAPTATPVPVIAPTSTPVVPSPNCLGSCPTPTSAVQPTTPIQPTSAVVQPTSSVPTTMAPSMNMPTAIPVTSGTPGSPTPGTGSGHHNLLALLLQLIALILHFLQTLI